MKIQNDLDILLRLQVVHSCPEKNRIILLTLESGCSSKFSFWVSTWLLATLSSPIYPHTLELDSVRSLAGKGKEGRHRVHIYFILLIYLWYLISDIPLSPLVCATSKWLIMVKRYTIQWKRYIGISTTLAHSRKWQKRKRKRWWTRGCFWMKLFLDCIHPMALPADFTRCFSICPILKVIVLCSKF